MSRRPQSFDETATLAHARRALRLVCAELPHLSGLVQAVRLSVDARVQTAAVTATGRILVNPGFFQSLTLFDAVFVMAHELMHLALETHRRGLGADGTRVNVAHDLIINDLLIHQLGRDGPRGILHEPGARHYALERLVAFFHQHPTKMPAPGWPTDDRDNAIGRAVRAPRKTPQAEIGDVIGPAREREWFPGDAPAEFAERADHVRQIAVQARALEAVFARVESPRHRAGEEAARTRTIAPLHGEYETPWESALQRWLDAVAPEPRTYSRPSRRGGDRSDVVLPGRRREAWTLHVILDASGSMWEHLPSALGALAWGCQAVGVDTVRVLQCDVDVTADELVLVERLAAYAVTGFRGAEGEHVPEQPHAAPALAESPPPPTPPERLQQAVYQPYVPPPAPAPVHYPWWNSSPDYLTYTPKPFSYTRPSGHRKPKPKPKSKPKPRGPKVRKKRVPPLLNELGAEPTAEHWHAADSDLSPAFRRVAADAAAGAVLVLTDGMAGFPAERPPFAVLWVLPSTEAAASFKPSYGTVAAWRIRR